MMSKEKIDATIAIPTYNRVMKLFHLLKSLDRLNPIPDEIIIIDDNSNDGTPGSLEKWKFIKKDYYKKLIFKNLNKNLADSRNLGIINSRNDLVAFKDDDVICR